MKLKLPSIRALSYFGFFICVAMIVAAVFMQYQLHLNPCPLCVLQRVVFMFLGVLFLIGALYVPRVSSRRIYYGFMLFVSMIGEAIALRQVWLQYKTSIGEPIHDCGADLTYMLHNFPLTETIKQVFSGSGECGKVQLKILTLSIPEWTAIVFFMLALLCLIQIVRSCQK